MKKMFLGLALLLIVSLFGAKNVKADNNPPGNEDVCTLTSNVKGAPEAKVWNVDYSNDGTIKVTVRVFDGGNDTFRVKVTPTSQFTGVVVEGALYCDCVYYSSYCICEGEVTFRCKVGKEGEAASCSAYTFIAEIIN